jgi:serine/threonine protein kinase
MGRVWLAEDELLERPVAVKELIAGDSLSVDSGRAARLRALGEARAAARVDHDGAVRVYDVVKDDGRPWIVMEALSGRTLADTLDAEGPLPVDQVSRVGLCLLDALQATHRAGIVHRDVKPGNVQLCDGGRVVLTDFGIACATDDGPGCPTDTFAGSPAYTSPQQLRGDRPGPACDLFSLGATLFTAVEGRPPFDKGDLYATLTAVAQDAPAPFLRAGPLRPVIEGLLAKQPHRRLSIDQARAALHAIQHDHPMPATGHRPRMTPQAT